jgi:hypothetical protein
MLRKRMNLKAETRGIYQETEIRRGENITGLVQRDFTQEVRRDYGKVLTKRVT